MIIPKRTKIVCTLGPASSSLEVMYKLGVAGMDVARLNFSHGTHEDHAKMFKRLELTGRKLGRAFGVLQDLQGPKIRVGDVPKEGVRLIAGGEAVFSTATKRVAGEIPVTLPTLHRDVRPKEHLLFDDGLLEVEVLRIEGQRIITEVVQGGILLPHKGLNLPGTTLHIPALSEKDRADAAFGVKLGVDYVALSFVRSAQDVKDLRKLLDSKGSKGKSIRIIAKIEKREAIDALDEILPLVDAIMVARGDLGIETPAAKVPVVQKQIISACRERAIPVIVATQMLDSMQRNPRPTRAEVSDIAHAVSDHADAVMLSGETATGAYPVEAVRIMSDTICETEASVFDDVSSVDVFSSRNVPGAVGATVRVLVEALAKPPVLVVTSDGLAVREVSSFRPETRVHAATSDAQTARALRLVWGVEPTVVPKAATTDAMVVSAVKALTKSRDLKTDDQLIVVASASPKGMDAPNRIEIRRV